MNLLTTNTISMCSISSICNASTLAIDNVASIDALEVTTFTIDGVELSATELNKASTMTSTPEQLNKLTNVTVKIADLDAFCTIRDNT